MGTSKCIGGQTKKAEPIVPAAEPKLDQATDEEGATLFVKNLNFDTTEETLKQIFSDVGEVRVVTIAKKKNTKKKDKTDKDLLSMGYGFIEYKTADAAKEALKKLQNTEVDGHQLLLKISNRKSINADTKGTKRKTQEKVDDKMSTKILVKNMPFEATSKDLRELFSAYGQVKKVRVPKKFDGSNRGFAFIDFLTKQEAKTAMETLFNTHLFGRRLILQWAKEDESVDEIRAKTSEQLLSGGKRKKAKIDIDSAKPFKDVV